LLKQWLALAQDTSPEAFVFPSESLVTPLSADNLWRRTMKPKLKEIGLTGRRSRSFGKLTPVFLKKRCWSEGSLRSERPRYRRQLGRLSNSDMEQKREALNKLEALVLRKPQSLKRSG
jgi:hypothetical protein